MTRPNQGLSSLAPDGKMRDPGNEVALYIVRPRNAKEGGSLTYLYKIQGIVHSVEAARHTEKYEKIQIKIKRRF